MNRRQLLATLGLAGVGAGAGLFYFDSSSPTPEDPSGPTDTAGFDQSGESDLVRYQRHINQLQEEAPPANPRYDFDYPEHRFKGIVDPSLSEIVARGYPELNGDVLTLTPGDITPRELATRLRLVWGVPDDDQVVRELEGARVQFIGGIADRRAYLLGVDEGVGETGVVRVTRARNLSDARDLTTVFTE